MNIKEFAQMLNNRSIGEEITDDECILAQEQGFVVVFGYSDDNAELRGAIDDEVGCYNGGQIFFNSDGVFVPCEDNCKYSKAAQKDCKEIQIICEEDGYFWTYDTAIPHETFDILDEEGNTWCRGIVFDIECW